MPMMPVATQNSGKLLACNAATPTRQPAMLIVAPVMNPARRPVRPIHSDIGIVASAEPSTYVVAPNVANVFAGASEKPIRPFIEIRPDALISSNAWQQASRKMSRRDVFTTGFGIDAGTAPESSYDKRTVSA